MADHPKGVFPLVFESGVIAFDEAGALHVHLSHSPDAPHPLRTHPDGSDGHVPGEVSRAEVRGGVADGVVHAGFLEADALPSGLELVISGYRMVKLEASGDLSVLVEEVSDPPSWFTPGKVHRFDGPDGPVRLWSGSAPPPRRTAARPGAAGDVAQHRAAPKAEAAPGAGAASEPKAGPSAKAGCGPLVALLLVGVALAAGVVAT